MSAHAPGPWRQVGVDGFTTAIWDSEANDVVASTKPLAAADARLIAAAPELLAVLQALATHIADHVDINNSGGPNWAMQLSDEFGERMTSALRKAVAS